MSCAAVVAIGLHLASWHSVPGYNNNNPGGYLRSSCGLVEDSATVQDGIQLGAYHNSERAFTAYAAYVVEAQPVAAAPWLGIFASLGFATGYRAHPVIPLAMTGLSLDTKPLILSLSKGERHSGAPKLRLGYIPKAGKVNDTHVLHLAIEWPL